MASKLYHDPCPVCNGVIDEGERAFLFGLDMREIPPVSLYAHLACHQARGRRGFVMVWPGQTLEEILTSGPLRQAQGAERAGLRQAQATDAVQADLFTGANALLAGGI